MLPLPVLKQGASQRDLRERYNVDIKFEDILLKLKESSNYHLYPLGEKVVLECNKIKFSDPHDRIIIATAGVSLACILKQLTRPQ